MIWQIPITLVSNDCIIEALEDLSRLARTFWYMELNESSVVLGSWSTVLLASHQQVNMCAETYGYEDLVCLWHFYGHTQRSVKKIGLIYYEGSTPQKTLKTSSNKSQWKVENDVGKIYRSRDFPICWRWKLFHFLRCRKAWQPRVLVFWQRKHSEWC